MLQHPERLRSLLAALVLTLTLQGAACHAQTPAPERAGVSAPREALADTAFARLVARLSEPGAYFDTDNLISNERSYLHVAPALHRTDAGGGAYIGVGPDQNFSYIALVRPRIAFVVDIRRDNLLLHVFYKALFGLARTRLDYLCLLFGRPLPEAGGGWEAQPLAALLTYIDRTPATPEAVASARAAVLTAAQRTGLPLSAADLETIGRFHTRFIEASLDLRFTSHGRPPRSYYPTYRQLLTETDRAGRQVSYLAREEDFQFVRGLQVSNLVVPVVGNLAGPHALREIGRYLSERGERVRAFYTSNVEDYLMREGQFERFIDNLSALPQDGQSVIVRSFFHYYRGHHPQAMPGYASTQILQPIGPLVQAYRRGEIRSYTDLVYKHVLDPD